MLVASASLSTAAAAQTQISSADSAVYARARQMVAAGNGAAGRVLVDSMVTVTPPETPAYAEALYWRATLAADATEAERDYRRIVVEYAISPRAGDALVQLANLELARGDRTSARIHLERFLLENPDHPERARTGLTLTRLSLDAGDLQRGCTTLGRTLREVPESNIELRNQLSFFSGRCANVDTTRRVAAATADTASVRRDTTKRDTTAKAAPKPAGKFTLQVAAYSSRDLADALVKRLAAKGLEARTVGTKSPFRVRVGYYKTRAAATAAATKLKAQKIEARVTEIGAEEG